MARLERRLLWNGTTHQVEAQVEGANLYLEIDGRAAGFTIVPGPPGTFVLSEGDRVITGYAVATDREIWVQLDGRTYVLAKEQPARRGASSGAGPAGGDVVSPMTGTVRKVFVEAGEPVAAGTPLLVVEAMKMEYTVSAPADGLVGKVLCAVGQAVDLGQVLLHLNPSEEKGS